MGGELHNTAPVAWHKAQHNVMSARISRILLKWLPFADQQFAKWSGRPNCGYFFGGAYWYGFETAFTASVYALLAVMDDYDEKLTGLPQTLVKQRAIQAIRYLGFTHDTGPEDCVRAEGINRFCSKQKWGGQGQKFFPASQTGRTVAALGIAAWLLWDELDGETRRMVQNVTISYADRWSVEEPRNGVYNDTQCEENSWTATGISAALAMFPNHPRHAQWLTGFSHWTINAMTTSKDKLADLHPPQDQPPLKISKITFHPDYTTENHGFVHPGYISAGINFRAIHAAFSLIGDGQFMACAAYNNEQVYGSTIKCWSQLDGLAVPLQGQDWWYNRQHERLLTHAMMNVLHEDSDAARLERSALAVIEQLQQSNSKGCLLEENGEQCRITGYQTALDMEHSSAHDLAISCLLHLFGGAGSRPTNAEELQTRLKGVRLYPYGSAIVHRTKDSFSSFSWRNRVMAVTLPKQGMWTITPVMSSYTGKVAFPSKGGKWENEEYIIEAKQHHVQSYEDGFAAMATMERGRRKLIQQVAFVSLPNGATLYIEQFKAMSACAVSILATGYIGIRNEDYKAMNSLAPGRKRLHFPHETFEFKGFYGQSKDDIYDFSAPYFLNLDHQIGYILFGSHGIRYINKHQYPKWMGVEDVLILNYTENLALSADHRLPAFILLTLPNHTMQETAEKMQNTMQLECTQEAVYCVVTGEYLIYANFQTRHQLIEARGGCSPRQQEWIKLFPGKNLIFAESWVWQGELSASQSGYLTSRYRLSLHPDVPAMEELSLDIRVLPDGLAIVNRGADAVSLNIALSHTEQHLQTITVEGGRTEWILDEFQ